MADTSRTNPPSDFVVSWLTTLRASGLLPGRPALDVAMGRGRHALALARAGFRVFGVDVDYESVADGVRTARSEGYAIAGWCADLIRHPLPRGRFDVVVVTRYLQRDLFPAIREAPSRGGFVLYETFTTAQRVRGSGPTSADHLLEPGELLERFRGFDVEFYEEVREPDAVARIVARRRQI
jgi:hypothetical protein